MAADSAGEDAEVHAIGSPGGPEGEDVLDVGSSSRVLLRWRPDWWRRAAGLLIVIVGAAGYLVFHDARQDAAAPVKSPPATATSAARPVQSSDADGLAAIAAMAQDSAPPAAYVRATSAFDSCRPAPSGGIRRPNIAKAIHRHIDGYVVQDSGRVLDQFTALCAATVRADDKAGSILVVNVVAPGGPAARPHWQIAATTLSSGRGVISLTYVAPGGWQINVGTVGPVADEPGSALLRLAEDPTLLW